MAQFETPGDLRRRNRSRVLGRVVREGATTRLALAAEYGLSSATASNVVRDLLNDGLVVENGSVPSRGGRPSSQITVNAHAAYFVGVDVGERGVIADLYDLALRQVDRSVVGVAARLARPVEIRRALDEAIGTLRSRNASAWGKVVGVGLGLPGIVDTSDSGTATLYAQSAGWEPIPVGELLSAPGVPVLADNGAKTYSLAELWRGAASQDDLTVVVLLGRGLGAGVIDAGRIFRGQSSSAGEWGHTKVTIRGRSCTCGATGCLESLIGGDAIAERYVDAGGRAAGSPEETLDVLISDADHGSRPAVEVLDETVEILGIGLSNLVNLFNPARIVIGGWAGRALMAARGDRIVRLVRELPLRHPAGQVEVVATDLGPDAVALGASLLVVQRFVDGELG